MFSDKALNHMLKQGAEQDHRPCGTTANCNCHWELEMCMVRAYFAPWQLLSNHPSEHLGGWLTLWLAEEMQDGRRQRADIPAYTRSAHNSLLQKTLEQNLLNHFLTSFQWQNQSKDLIEQKWCSFTKRIDLQSLWIPYFVKGQHSCLLLLFCLFFALPWEVQETVVGGCSYWEHGTALALWITEPPVNPQALLCPSVAALQTHCSGDSGTLGLWLLTFSMVDCLPQCLVFSVVFCLLWCLASCVVSSEASWLRSVLCLLWCFASSVVS